LDIRFPEYRQAFENIFSTRSLATLRRFPAPSDLLQLTPQQIVEIWGEYMTRPGGVRGKKLIICDKNKMMRIRFQPIINSC